MKKEDDEVDGISKPEEPESPIYNEPEKPTRKKKAPTATPIEQKPSVPTSEDSALIDTELRGRTLRAYLFILKSPKPIGVRELQRALGLSSPSVAYHHLDKLTKIGLVEKDQYGEYALVKSVNVNVLQAFTQIGRLLIPRFIFYAVFFTTLLLGYVFVFLHNLNSFAVAFGLFASIFAWYETYRTWKKRPF